MKTIFLITLLALAQYVQAAPQINSPDGAWTVQQVVQGDKSVVALFGKDSIGSAVVLVNDLSDAKAISVKWSADSKHVAVLERDRQGPMFYAGWLDGAKWHKTLLDGKDVQPLLAMAKNIGKKSSVYRTETGELGKWVAPDTIEIKGTLGINDVSYTAKLQIVPGNYPLSPFGFEIGALKLIDIHVEPVVTNGSKQ